MKNTNPIQRKYNETLCELYDERLTIIVEHIEKLKNAIMQYNVNDGRHIFLEPPVRLFRLLDDNLNRDTTLFWFLKTANDDEIPKKLFELSTLNEQERERRIKIIADTFPCDCKITIIPKKITYCVINFYSNLLGYNLVDVIDNPYDLAIEVPKLKKEVVQLRKDLKTSEQENIKKEKKLKLTETANIDLSNKNIILSNENTNLSTERDGLANDKSNLTTERNTLAKDKNKLNKDLKKLRENFRKKLIIAITIFSVIFVTTGFSMWFLFINSDDNVLSDYTDAYTEDEVIVLNQMKSAEQIAHEIFWTREGREYWGVDLVRKEKLIAYGGEEFQQKVQGFLNDYNNEERRCELCLRNS